MKPSNKTKAKTKTEDKKMKNTEMTELSLNELDQISAGTAFEMMTDSRFLNSLNGSTKRMGFFDCWLNVEAKREIAAAWAKVGIQVQLDDLIFGYDNRYFLNGKQISLADAQKHAMTITGHQMNEQAWNY